MNGQLIILKKPPILYHVCYLLYFCPCLLYFDNKFPTIPVFLRPKVRARPDKSIGHSNFCQISTQHTCFPVFSYAFKDLYTFSFRRHLFSFHSQWHVYIAIRSILWVNFELFSGYSCTNNTGYDSTECRSRQLLKCREKIHIFTPHWEKKVKPKWLHPWSRFMVPFSKMAPGWSRFGSTFFFLSAKCVILGVNSGAPI